MPVATANVAVSVGLPWMIGASAMETGAVTDLLVTAKKGMNLVQRVSFRIVSIVSRKTQPTSSTSSVCSTMEWPAA
jgi:hypothetical protein